MRVLDPLVEFFLGAVRDVEVCKQLGAKAQIRYLIVGSNIVDLADGTFVQNGVESIGGISGVEVTSSRGTVSVEDKRLPSVQETCELGNDLCASSII